MPLATLPLDPEPTAAELAAYMAKTTIIDPVIRCNFARLQWQADQQQANPNLFAVPFSPHEGYPDYLASPLWASIRGRVLTATPMCVGCNRYASQVHHRDYRPRVLSGEDLTPLIPVCASCHRRVHVGKPEPSWEDQENRLQALVAEKEGGRVERRSARRTSLRQPPG